MSTMNSIDLLIDGTSRPASDAGRVEVRSPANGQVVGSVARATLDDLQSAVDAAGRAFLKWSAVTAYEREKIIRKATAHVRTQVDALGRLMALEQGKPLAQARSEIVGSCDTLDYFASEGPRIEGYTNPTEDPSYRSWVIYQPVGVCGLITPWNYPVSLLSWKLGPLLATGCTAVIKPTPVTPMAPIAFCKALTDGGIPPGVLNAISGPGALLGEALVRHPEVVKIAMTGSTATGKRIMEMAGPMLKKISLELGGQCPALVCADADIDLAAKVIAYKGWRNMGQSCSSVNRVYAHSSIHDALVQKLRVIGEGMTLGDGLSNPNVDLGPMATRDGLATVELHVADAVQQGARLICGGKRPPGEAFAAGHFYQPTLLTEVSSSMKVMREETFGPVIPVVRFDKIDDAISQANHTAFGLVAYLFTRDFANTVKVSEALEAGTVCVNHGAVNTNYGPYAGWKESGYGVELSRRAVFEYLKTKHVKVQLS